MKKIEALNLDTALELTPDFYKPTIKYLYHSALLGNEKVIFIAKATRHEVREERNWSSFSSEWKTTRHYSNIPSLVVLTNYRWIRKWTRWSNEQGLLFSDKKEKERFLKTMKSGYRWSETYTAKPPDEKSSERQGGKTIEEWAMSNINFAPLHEINAHNKQIRYTNHNDLQQQYLLFTVNTTDYSFCFEDGENLFQLLQEASTNGGRIALNDEPDHLTGESVSDSEIVQRLRNLKELFEATLITEAEYHKKKDEIISNL